MTEYKGKLVQLGYACFLAISTYHSFPERIVTAARLASAKAAVAKATAVEKAKEEAKANKRKVW